MSWRGRLEGIFCPSVPAARLAAVRVLVGGFALVYLVARFPHLWRLSRFTAGQFRPTGVVHLLSSPLAPWQWHALLIVTTLSALAFALGFRHRVLAPFFALGFLFTLSYRNSWGMIFHTENLMVLHVGILALAPASHGFSLDARASKKDYADSWYYGWPLVLMGIVTTAAYFLAGYAKLRHGGFSWASGEVLRNYVAMDNLRKLLLGDIYSPLAAPTMRFDVLFTVLASASLALELLAPLSLFSRRFARLWVPGMVGFHLGIVLLMAIVFPSPLTGIAFVSFYRAELLLQRIATRWSQLRDKSRARA